MLLATAVYFIIDRRYIKSAVYCGIGALLSFFGIIHSGVFGVNVSPAVTLAYLGAGLVLIFMHFYRRQDNACPDEDDVGVLSIPAAENETKQLP